MNQSLDGESAKAIVCETLNLRLIEVETPSGGGLRPSYGFDDLIYGNRLPDFRLFFLCIA